MTEGTDRDQSVTPEEVEGHLRNAADQDDTEGHLAARNTPGPNLVRNADDEDDTQGHRIMP